MGKSNKPEYSTTTTNTGGLFGSSTSGKSGTSFTGEEWQKDMGGSGTQLINNSLYNMLTNDYSNDANFQAYKDNFNREMQQAYDTNVLANLNDRGLMRSSALQSATNSFNNSLQEGLTDLYDDYYNRQVNNLNAGLNSQNNLYNWIMGVNQDASNNSKNVSNHNMQGYQTDQALKGQMYQAIGQAIGGLGGGLAKKG